MAWRLALLWLVIAALPAVASANGRPPSASSIVFRQGNDREIAVGLTFGLVVSRDAGATWEWICESAIGYSGEYDPRYAFTDQGSLFATTHTGLKVARDSCTFSPVSAVFASTDALAADRTLYYAASEPPDLARGQPGDYRIYRSSDDGASFAPTAAQPEGPISWWQSLAAAPSAPQVLYLAGYVYVRVPSGGTRKEQRLYRSDDGGAAWTALPLDAATVTVMANSLIDIVGISRSDPGHLYIRVTYDDNVMHHSIYRSTDKGVTWQRILRRPLALDAFVVRSNGDLIAGGPALGAEISHDDGDTWSVLAGAPHGRCLVENAAGELWACAENYGRDGAPSDGAGIVKTIDPELGSWTPVLRYQDLTRAVSCAAGTVQGTECAQLWCSVCDQLGCEPAADYGCPEPMEAPIVVPPRRPAGCCDGGAGGAGALAAAGLVGMVVLRRRRRGT